MTRLWWVLHLFIVANLAVEFLYASYQVFFVVVPPGHPGGPLFGAAEGLDHELMVTRRLYALEGWVAFGALAVYLAVTEVGPRRARAREG